MPPSRWEIYSFSFESQAATTAHCISIPLIVNESKPKVQYSPKLKTEDIDILKMLMISLLLTSTFLLLTKKGYWLIVFRMALYLVVVEVGGKWQRKFERARGEEYGQIYEKSRYTNLKYVWLVQRIRRDSFILSRREKILSNFFHSSSDLRLHVYFKH